MLALCVCDICWCAFAAESAKGLAQSKMLARVIEMQAISNMEASSVHGKIRDSSPRLLQKTKLSLLSEKVRELAQVFSVQIRNDAVVEAVQVAIDDGITAALLRS
jgi:hypothetical protein